MRRPAATQFLIVRGCDDFSRLGGTIDDAPAPHIHAEPIVVVAERRRRAIDDAPTLRVPAEPIVVVAGRRRRTGIDAGCGPSQGSDDASSCSPSA